MKFSSTTVPGLFSVAIQLPYCANAGEFEASLLNFGGNSNHFSGLTVGIPTRNLPWKFPNRIPIEMPVVHGFERYQAPTPPARYTIVSW
eukprot:3879731-Rhodomonas_salina.1